jgi:16S rRNA (guanine966-N2)-methyltransferase
MRIIAGIYRSRRLKSLRGRKLRPTSDRLRETLFNILGPLIEGSRFVDLYAGTGAVGIEALSRGAAEVIFIEKHPPAANLIRRNLDSLGVTSGAAILSVDALRGVGMLAAQQAAAPEKRMDIVFVDPPWDDDKEYALTLGALGSVKFLSSGARVVVEHHRSFSLAGNYGRLRLARVLKQGDAALSFFELAA